MSLFDLAGKKAIVTGGSRGLGKAMAEGLMEQGAEIVVIGTSSSLDDIVRAWHENGWKAHAIKADIRDRQQLERAFNEGLEKLNGELNILLNCAGIQRRHKSEEFPVEDWDAVIDINLTAVFLLCQMAARIMIPAGGGKIINIASMLSFFGGFTVPAYAASKGGVAQLTKAFANEWARYNISVNAIAPGYMDTDMNVNLIADPVRNDEIIKRIPAGRWGKPEDMKGTAIFLASSASDYLNGAIIPVDGGYLSR